MSTPNPRYAAGLMTLDEIDGPAGRQVVTSLEQVAPDLARFIVEFGFCDVYGRPGFDRRSREITTIAALTVLGGCEPQLSIHVGAGLNVGLTPHEIIETITHACFYAGFPRSINAIRVAQQVFAERGVDPTETDSPYQVVQDFITALRERDPTQAHSLAHPDAVWVVSGFVRSGDEVRELLGVLGRQRLGDIRMVLPAGEHVLVLGTGPLMPGLAGDFVLHFIVKGGLVAFCQIHQDGRGA
jgi:4-carboxymuconolactone decarboxylase